MSLLAEIQKNKFCGQEIAVQKNEIRNSGISCGHSRQWLARGAEIWRCEICDPPTKEIFVKQRRDLAVHADQHDQHSVQPTHLADPILSTQRTSQPAPQHVPQHAPQHVPQHVADIPPTPVIISYERPACPHCQSTWIVESYGPDGRTCCWSCRRVITTLLVVEQHAERRLLPWREDHGNDTKRSDTST